MARRWKTSKRIEQSINKFLDRKYDGAEFRNDIDRECGDYIIRCNQVLFKDGTTLCDINVIPNWAIQSKAIDPLYFLDAVEVYQFDNTKAANAKFLELLAKYKGEEVKA